jgi:two-component system NtrC family sensor kinase
MSSDQERIAALEAELARVREQMFQMGRLVEMGKLIAVVAHELSQPLLGIKAFAQILQRRCDEDEYIGPKVRLILQQAKVLEGIIETLREFTRAHADDPAGVSLGPVVAAAVELFSERVRKGRVDVQIEIPPDAPPARGNRVQLQQVFVNLISNALDVLQARQDGRILVKLERAGEFLVAWVADNGPGVPVDLRARIFDAFTTTKGSENGTGLGLSICRDILRLRGGEILLLEPDRVAGALGPDWGAVFEVRIPVLGATSADGHGEGGASGA